jgi:hypothetical protein
MRRRMPASPYPARYLAAGTCGVRAEAHWQKLPLSGARQPVSVLHGPDMWRPAPADSTSATGLRGPACPLRRFIRPLTLILVGENPDPARGFESELAVPDEAEAACRNLHAAMA